jgi:hypothetical protein
VTETEMAESLNSRGGGGTQSHRYHVRVCVCVCTYASTCLRPYYACMYVSYVSMCVYVCKYVRTYRYVW